MTVDWPRVGRALGAQLLALVLATIAVVLLEYGAGLRQASSVYLLAVASVAIGFGSWAAAGTAFGSFLTYNYLFVEPRYTFTVGQPDEILNLLLLLVLGIVIGRLTGLQRDRAREAQRREREARALFAVSRALAEARRASDAFESITSRLAQETSMRRLWIGVGSTVTREQVVADSQEGEPRIRPAALGQHFLLRRTSDERRSEWVRISPPRSLPSGPTAQHLYRVAISDGTDEIGSVWALRDTAVAPPQVEETRLLAATADQVGQSILRDRLAVQATELEIAQRSDELKTALLDSVSHDLRTPLATIRAAAGSLADPEVSWDADARRTAARQIDLEAERLNRIVTNLLDMSRLQAGSLHPQIEVLPLAEVVGSIVDRARTWLGARPISVEVGDDLPPALADPVLLDQVLTNVLENVARHTPPRTPLRIDGRVAGERVAIRVDDGGPGVPAEAIGSIFDKFYRYRSAAGGSRRGTGLGLAVVKGMVEAMGGNVSASISEMGGLAIRIELPAAEPAGESASAADAARA